MIKFTPNHTFAICATTIICIIYMTVMFTTSVLLMPEQFRGGVANKQNELLATWHIYKKQYDGNYRSMSGEIQKIVSSMNRLGKRVKDLEEGDPCPPTDYDKVIIDWHNHTM